jgi:ATP-dependent 26S proteasome regulatory subunit
MPQVKKFCDEVKSLIKARYPLILLQTYEESRVLGFIKEINFDRDSEIYLWSRASGVFKMDKSEGKQMDPMAVLNWYDALNEKSVLILRDYHPYLKDPGIVRKIRELGQKFKNYPKNIIFVSPVMEIPVELAKDIIHVDVPLPNKDEIRKLVVKAAKVIKFDTENNKEETDRLVNAATGLTFDEIENVLAKSIVSNSALDPLMIQSEKKEIVKKSGVLEFITPKRPSQSNNIGGLDNLKKWLRSREKGLKDEAREIGLPAPKGMLLVGVPGCGKSLTASTIAQEWQLPLLRLDMGRVFSGLVGSSEQNIRQAVATAEAVAPCVLWIDEIEKGLSGTKSGGDGGTASRVFGTVLTWMQEKTSMVFVVATANDISGLPPEFLRKGRFDEIFYVDLPHREERGEIFKIQMARYGWEVKDLDLEKIMDKMQDFSGAEIEQVLVEARYHALNYEEEFSQKHVLESISETVPLAKTMGEQIQELRSWAKHRARPASNPPGSDEEENSFEQRTKNMEIEK